MLKMEPAEQKVRKELDALFDGVKTLEDLKNIPFLIDDYLEEGYNVKDYIQKYNCLVRKFYSENKN